MTRSRSCLSKPNYHRSILLKTKTFKNRRNNSFRISIRSYIHSLINSKTSRKQKSSLFKNHWIKTIKTHLSLLNLKYSKFIPILINKTSLNKKILYLLITNKELNLNLPSLIPN